MRIINMVEDPNSENILRGLEERGKFSIDRVEEAVQEILVNIKSMGDQAILDYTKHFDKVALDRGSIKVSEEEFSAAYKSLGKDEVNAIKRAMKNIRLFHIKQKRELDFVKIENGIKIAQVLRPIGRVGVYVPGGLAIYPSTVLMTVVPAKIAGAKIVVLCTPPRRDGKINPSVLVAAREAGVDAVFKIGGAQAIAAMAYGTETVPRVNKIVGPGNIYVTAAKILVSHEVAIDSPAGPSEILILADEFANPRYVAADMIAQCEHGPDSVAILVTPSKSLADEVTSQINLLKKKAGRPDIIQKALDNSGWILLVRDITHGVSVVNRIAPEHLEILLKNPTGILSMIENSGAIFLGEYSPVAAGDYAVGSNHVLPTGGYARMYSGLSLRDFTKVIDVVYCTREGLGGLKNTIYTLARVEGFDSHRKSILVRFENDLQ